MPSDLCRLKRKSCVGPWRDAPHHDRHRQRGEHAGRNQPVQKLGRRRIAADPVAVGHGSSPLCLHNHRAQQRAAPCGEIGIRAMRSARLANLRNRLRKLQDTRGITRGRDVRPDCAGAVQERGVFHRRRDGADRVPHHLFGRAQGQHGLFDRLCRRGRQARRAGADPARPSRLGADRDGIDHAPLRATTWRRATCSS